MSAASPLLLEMREVSFSPMVLSWLCPWASDTAGVARAVTHQSRVTLVVMGESHRGAVGPDRYSSSMSVPCHTYGGLMSPSTSVVVLGES